MRRAIDAALGVVVLGLVAVLVLVVVLVYDKAFVSTVRVQLHTSSIGNSLSTGSDVEVRGVPVGRVTKISTDGDGAVLTLDIDPDQAKKIPADSVAQLLPKTLFGERYVALMAPTDDASTGTGTDGTGSGTEAASDSGSGSGSDAGTSDVGYLRSGDVLHEDTSAESVQLQQVLDDLLPLLKAVQPEKLNALLGELSAALRGNGRSLGDTATIAASYLGKLNPMVPQLSDDLGALGRVAHNYSQAVPDLLTSLDNFSTTTRTIAHDHRALSDTLSRVTDASDAGTGFLSDNQETIVVISRQSRRALNVVRPFARTFPCLFSSLRGFIPRMDTDLGSGTDAPGLHADVTIVAAHQRSAEQPSGDEPSCPVNRPDPDSGTAFGTQGDPATGAAGTAASAAATGTDGSAGAGSEVADLGQANSPQENRVLAELLAPAQGISPEQFPRWGSLLLGPILRGADLDLR